MAYATAAQLLQLGLPGRALTDVSTADRNAALDAASDLADSYLRSRFELPLTAWGDDLRRAVCSVAVYDLLSRRGYNPEQGADDNIRARHDDAVRWLEKVAAGLVSPSVTDSSTPATAGSGARVRSHDARGW